jgi:hypothetical protein
MGDSPSCRTSAESVLKAPSCAALGAPSQPLAPVPACQPLPDCAAWLSGPHRGQASQLVSSQACGTLQAQQPTNPEGRHTVEYEVTWTVNVTAGSAIDAARQALEMQRDPASTATVFTVLAETGYDEVIDLETIDADLSQARS